MKRLLSVVVLMFSLVLGVRAEDVVTAPAKSLTSEQLLHVRSGELATKVESYGKWVGFGREIGTAVNETLSALTKNTEDLANTRVGTVAMILVVWKVAGSDMIRAGRDLLRIPIGIFLEIVLIAFCVWSLRRMVFGHPVLISKAKDGTKTYQWVPGAVQRQSEQGDLDVMFAWGFHALGLLLFTKLILEFSFA